MWLKRNAFNVTVAVVLTLFMVLTATLGLVAVKQQQFNSLVTRGNETENKLSGQPYDLVFAAMPENSADCSRQTNELAVVLLAGIMDTQLQRLVQSITPVLQENTALTPVNLKVVLLE